MMSMNALLEIKNLSVQFDTDEGRILAVNNISLSLNAGEVLGIVGESGSGKSVTAKSIMQLNPYNTHYDETGEIIIDNENVGFNEKNITEELIAYTKHKLGI